MKALQRRWVGARLYAGGTRAVADGESGLLNTGIKVIHHELSEVQPDYSSLPPSCAVGGVGGSGGVWCVWCVRGF